jgi:hypothetical protein
MSEKRREKVPPPSSSFLTSPRNISHLIYLCYRCMYLLFTFFFFFFNRRIKRFVFFQKTFHPCEEKKSDATRRDCKRWYESEKATVYDESSRVESSRERERRYISSSSSRTGGRLDRRLYVLLAAYFYLIFSRIYTNVIFQIGIWWSYVSWLRYSSDIKMIINNILIHVLHISSVSGDSQHEPTDRRWA